MLEEEKLINNNLGRETSFHKKISEKNNLRETSFHIPAHIIHPENNNNISNPDTPLGGGVMVLGANTRKEYQEVAITSKLQPPVSTSNSILMKGDVEKLYNLSPSPTSEAPSEPPIIQKAVGIGTVPDIVFDITGSSAATQVVNNQLTENDAQGIIIKSLQSNPNFAHFTDYVLAERTMASSENNEDIVQKDSNKDQYNNLNNGEEGRENNLQDGEERRGENNQDEGENLYNQVKL